MPINTAPIGLRELTEKDLKERRDLKAAVGGAVQGKKTAVVSAVVVLIAALVARFLVFGGGASAPSLEELETAFKPVAGYEYQVPPPEVQAMLDAFLEKMPQAGSAQVERMATRIITRNQTMIAVAVVGSIDPDELAQMDERTIASELAGGGGGALTTKKRAGVTMFETRGTQGFAVAFLDEDGMVFGVSGRDKKSVRDIGKQLALANR